MESEPKIEIFNEGHDIPRPKLSRGTRGVPDVGLLLNCEIIPDGIYIIFSSRLILFA